MGGWVYLQDGCCHGVHMCGELLSAALQQPPLLNQALHVTVFYLQHGTLLLLGEESSFEDETCPLHTLIKPYFFAPMKGKRAKANYIWIYDAWHALGGSSGLHVPTYETICTWLSV
eukprot:1157333-Pelagomonas_calceolata.AAC.3